MKTRIYKDSHYICMNCGGAFTRGNRKCLVNHPSGKCCHEYDEPFIQPDQTAITTMFYLKDDRFKFKKVPVEAKPDGTQ